MIKQVLVRGNIGTNGEFRTETYFEDMEYAIRAAKRHWDSTEMGEKPTQLNCDWIEYKGDTYYACEFDQESCWDKHTTCMSGDSATARYDDPTRDVYLSDNPLCVEDYEVVSMEDALKDDIYLCQFIYDESDFD